ncbi:jg23951, partial [Pararge aegeria aegeria]
YYDVPAIINLVDIVNLNSFDYYTAARNPKEADYTSPTYKPQNRNELLNVDSSVNYWLAAGAPSSKVVLGIATYGRTWKLDSDSEISGVPPLHANEAGEADSKWKAITRFRLGRDCPKVPVHLRILT